MSTKKQVYAPYTKEIGCNPSTSMVDLDMDYDEDSMQNESICNPSTSMVDVHIDYGEDSTQHEFDRGENDVVASRHYLSKNGLLFGNMEFSYSDLDMIEGGVRENQFDDALKKGVNDFYSNACVW